MPILMPNGEYISRKETKKPQSKKKHIRKVAKTKTSLRNREAMTAGKAKYILDMQQARYLRDITRED